jgi:uncharacterized protein (UPF0332 family)
MSPRSEEFMASAHERLQAARATLAGGFPSSAVSAGYYAMLYAARAALSEEELNAKTHRGVWSLFSEAFVASGRFERRLFAAAQRAQDLREAADYEAGSVSREQADAILTDADRFVSAVASMLGA